MMYIFSTYSSFKENNDRPIAVACFDRLLQKLSVNCYVDHKFISSTNYIALLHTVVTVICDVAVLQTYMYAVTVLLLLRCGDKK